jgi:hypothetical protein
MAILAFLFHRIIMGDAFAFLRPDGKIPWHILLFHFAALGMMVHIYPMGYSGKKPVLEGYRFGADIGFIIIVAVASVFERTGISDTTILVDVLWHTLIEEPAVGIVIALIYGRGAEKGSWSG